jgi:aspartate-semialdehyde dehydrogenase
MAKEKYNVAVVGALGVVGTEMIRTLERRNFPIGEFRPLDIPENAGKEVTYNGEPVKVQAAVKENFKDIDIAIFSAGATASQALAPQAVEMGAVVVDNSTAWRMEPLHDAGKIKRVVVSTYQAASGAGMKGLQGLTDEAEEYLKTGKRVAPRVHAVQLAFNAVPHIDVFQEHGYTKEEYKMIGETQKIFGDDSIKISPTAVRIPVWYGHSESINIETEKKITADQARDILSKAPGILLKDDPANNVYPTPLDSNEEDLTMVGRSREDLTIENGLNLWVVSNNIRKGAALNAVQIAETLIRMDLVRV